MFSLEDRFKIIKMAVEKNRNNTFNTPLIPKNTTDAFKWLMEESSVPMIKLNVPNIPRTAVLEEILEVERNNFFVGHRNEQYEHRGWTSFCIHGKSWNATKEDQHYNDDREYSFTAEAQSMMPKTVDFFKQQWFGNTFFRVRIMRLAPKGFILMHTDGSHNIAGPVNIAVTQPKGCEFLFEDFGVVPFEVGSAFLLNICPMHCVINDSNEVRYHIIVHHDKVTQEYKNHVLNEYDKGSNNSS